MNAVVSRFMKFVDKSGPGGCWLWTGHKERVGYGRFWIDGENRQAHRIAYGLFVGAVPDGLYVCHTCDVRHCVNPDHLWLGDDAANMADMIAKGRSTMGEANHKAKLSLADVVSIKARCEAGRESLKSIAIEYGVGYSTIRNIKIGHSWSRALEWNAK